MSSNKECLFFSLLILGGRKADNMAPHETQQSQIFTPTFRIITHKEYLQILPLLFLKVLGQNIDNMA
jgi:hypothetical protein